MLRPARGAILLATIPYLLLSGSQHASLRTHVCLNGSGTRTVEVSVDPSRQAELTRWLVDSHIGAGPEHITQATGAVVISRSTVTADFDRLGESIRLQISDVLQHPVGLFSYYDWSEDMLVEPAPATQVELAGQPQAVLNYELNLPGDIIARSVTPGGQVEEGRVTWQLPGAAGTYRLHAASRAFRWGYLLLVLYVLGFIAYRIFTYIARVLSYRPQRI